MCIQQNIYIERLLNVLHPVYIINRVTLRLLEPINGIGRAGVCWGGRDLAVYENFVYDKSLFSSQTVECATILHSIIIYTEYFQEITKTKFVPELFWCLTRSNSQFLYIAFKCYYVI